MQPMSLHEEYYDVMTKKRKHKYPDFIWLLFLLSFFFKFFIQQIQLHKAHKSKHILMTGTYILYNQSFAS